MRKIKTKAEINKEERRNRLIVGIILVSIMILSVVGYAFFSGGRAEQKKKKINYKGVDFLMNEQGFWQTEINEYTFLTAYNPEETENITLDFYASLNQYYNKPLFIISENNLATAELIRNIGDFVGRYQYACLEGEECKGNLPLKNCTENIIIIKQAETIKSYKNESCIFIEAPYEQQIRATDAVIFKLLGIN